MTQVIELSHNKRVVILDGGRALILERRKNTQAQDALKKRRRKYTLEAWAKRVEADWQYLEDKVWIPRVRRFFIDTGDELAKRLSSRSRRMAKVLREGRDATSTAKDPKAYADAQAAKLVDDVWDEEAFKVAFADLVADLEDDTAQMAWDALQNALGISFDQPPAQVTQDILMARSNQLAGHVAQSTYNQLKRNLRDGILKGESIPDLAARVKGGFRQASTRRATVIARTEVPSAYNGTVWAGGQSLPDDVAAGMQWITTHDHRTRPAHRTAGGQIVKTGEKFHVGGEDLRYPGDPEGRPGNIIQCRCATAIVLPEDMPDDMRSTGYERRGVSRVMDLLTRIAMGEVSYPDALVELRGDKPGHKFHGNQWSGTYKQIPVAAQSRNQLLATLSAHGYTGPTSYTKQKLAAITTQHLERKGHVSGTLSGGAPATLAGGRPSSQAAGVTSATGQSHSGIAGPGTSWSSVLPGSAPAGGPIGAHQGPLGANPHGTIGTGAAAHLPAQGSPLHNAAYGDPFDVNVARSVNASLATQSTVPSSQAKVARAYLHQTGVQESLMNDFEAINTAHAISGNVANASLNKIGFNAASVRPAMTVAGAAAPFSAAAHSPAQNAYAAFHPGQAIPGIRTGAMTGLGASSASTAATAAPRTHTAAQYQNMTRAQIINTMRANGYTGPTSYTKGQLASLAANHMNLRGANAMGTSTVRPPARSSAPRPRHQPPPGVTQPPMGAHSRDHTKLDADTGTYANAAPGYKPAKHHGDPDKVLDDADDYIKNRGAFSHSSASAHDHDGATHLAGAYNAQGYNAKPTHVTNAQLKTMADSGDYYIVHRGVTRIGSGPGQDAISVAKSYTEGPKHYAGYGIYGNGTYTSNVRNTASSYAGHGGAMTTMALPKTAKIISYSDADAMMKKDTKYKAAASKHGISAVDQGHWATTRGYDAIVVDHGGREAYFVILNRSATYVTDPTNA